MKSVLRRLSAHSRLNTLQLKETPPAATAYTSARPTPRRTRSRFLDRRMAASTPPTSTAPRGRPSEKGALAEDALAGVPAFFPLSRIVRPDPPACLLRTGATTFLFSQSQSKTTAREAGGAPGRLPREV